MAEYVANHVVALPNCVRYGSFGEPVYDGTSKRFEPGEKITQKDLEDAAQTEEQVEELVRTGAIRPGYEE